MVDSSESEQSKWSDFRSRYERSTRVNITDIPDGLIIEVLPISAQLITPILVSYRVVDAAQFPDDIHHLYGFQGCVPRYRNHLHIMEPGRPGIFLLQPAMAKKVALSYPDLMNRAEIKAITNRSIHWDGLDGNSRP